MTAGIISPSSSFWLVRALNCLQNSMMLICACPSAGPTGGAGVALPAAICNFTEPVTFFAIISSYLRSCGDGRPRPSARAELDNLRRLLLHLLELQLHRSRTSEDRDHHLQRLAVFVHVIHDTGESSERSFADTYRLALFKFNFELRPVLRLAGFINNVLHFFFRKRRGLLPGADESRDSRRGFHHMPDVIIHVHFDQHVTGIEHALDGVLFATANLSDRFSRDQHLADLVFQAECAHSRLQRLFYLAFKPRV